MPPVKVTTVEEKGAGRGESGKSRCRFISSSILVAACAAALAFIVLAREVDLFTVRANVSLGFFIKNPAFDKYLVNAEFIFYFNKICSKAAGTNMPVCWTYDEWHDTIQAMLGLRFKLHPTAAFLIGVFNAFAIALSSIGLGAAVAAFVVEAKELARSKHQQEHQQRTRRIGFALISWFDLVVVIMCTSSLFCGLISFLFFNFITPYTKVVDFFTYTLGSAAYYNLAFIAVTAVAIGFATAGNAKVIWDALSSFIIEMELQQASTSEGVISDAHDVRISALSSEESSSLTAEQGNSSKSMRWPSSPSSNGGRSGAYSV